MFDTVSRLLRVGRFLTQWRQISNRGAWRNATRFMAIGGGSGGSALVGPLRGLAPLRWAMPVNLRPSRPV